MTTMQTMAAIEEFSARFGEPYWAEDKQEKILADWDCVLKNYSEIDVRTACGALSQFGKLKTFPTIGHLAAELKKNYQPISSSDSCEKRSPFMDELAQYRFRCIQDGVNGHLCFSADVDEAMRRVMDEINAEYPPEHHWETRTVSDLIGLALRNGVFWDKLDAHLRHIVEGRVSYSASGVVGELFDLPKTFKSTEERKCA